MKVASKKLFGKWKSVSDANLNILFLKAAASGVAVDGAVNDVGEDEVMQSAAAAAVNSAAAASGQTAGSRQ